MHNRAVIPRLHILTDDAILARPDFLPISEELLVVLGEQLALHVRGHNTAANRLFALSDALAQDAALTQALLIVNDRVDIALGARAGGIQLGARTLPIAAARQIAPDLRIGYSAHSRWQAVDASRDGADFIIAGSVYATASHPDATPGGPALLEACVSACATPVYAIGGITQERLGEVRRTGAHGVAVISAVWNAADPVHAAGEFVKILETWIP